NGLVKGSILIRRDQDESGAVGLGGALEGEDGQVIFLKTVEPARVFGRVVDDLAVEPPVFRSRCADGLSGEGVGWFPSGTDDGQWFDREFVVAALESWVEDVDEDVAVEIDGLLLRSLEVL